MNDDLKERIRTVAKELRGKASLSPFCVRVVERTDGTNGPAAVCTVTSDDGGFWCCGARGTGRDALIGMLRTLEDKLVTRRLAIPMAMSESGTFVSSL